MRTFPTLPSVAVVLAWSQYASAGSRFPAKLPPQTVIVDPLQYNALGTNGSFRSSAFTQFFNPTNVTPPFFQAFDPAFLDILGPNPSFRVIASNPDWAFAHEAPIWISGTNEVFFTSNGGGPLGHSDIDHNNQVSKISMTEVESSMKAANSSTAALNVTLTPLDLADSIQMTNGGTGPYKGSLIFMTQGRGTRPPVMALVNPAPPYNVTVLLDNFLGRQFNSLNDVKIHPQSKKLFFTDVAYGWLTHFRPLPLLPNQVYQFDPETGSVRVVADGFKLPNGLAFTPDGNTAYVTDTGALGGFFGDNQTDPSTIYAFDVHPKTQAFSNRRVFAYVDTGIADGIQLDSNGNVYAGCGDGTHVWSPEGVLLGKIFTGSLSANMIFAGKGNLVILGETQVYLAQIAAEGIDLAY